MLYLLAEYFNFEGLFNLVRYQTARAGATLLTALLIGLLIGPRFIDMLRVRQGKGQPIREDGPQTHLAKVGTPTMGGLMILASLTLSMLLWMVLRKLRTAEAAARRLKPIASQVVADLSSQLGQGPTRYFSP